MGNQGMTNWKFSAFLAIALILVAGMFASTAIAADGDGQVTVSWAPDRAGDAAKLVPQTAPTAATDPLPSGSTENELVFTYSLDDTEEINMSGGAFELRIPSGWKVSKGLITIIDEAGAGDTTLYDTDKDGKVDNVVIGNDDLPPQARDHADRRARVTILPSSGDLVSSVKVTLDADWEAADDGRTLTIQFSLVEVPIPSSLPFDDGPTESPDYQEYRFLFLVQCEGRRTDPVEAD